MRARSAITARPALLATAATLAGCGMLLLLVAGWAMHFTASAQESCAPTTTGTLATGRVPAALVQEYMPVERYLASLSEPVARELADAGREQATLLSALNGRVGAPFTAGQCRITASLAGPTRAAHLDIKPSDPLLVLTQTADLSGVPAYISKSAIPPTFAHLGVTQWTFAGGR